HLKRQFRFTDNMAFSVEIDPTEIDADRLNILFDAGLSRASVGVQDFNPIIQQAIGRPQSFEQTKSCFDMLRSGGIDSVNVDLLYGLPHQSAASFATTIDKVLSLAPDRIAMFGYAHVPWMAQRQKLIDAASLPDSATRYRLLAQGRQRFTTSGYVPVGIDHFAKPDDGLVDALNNQTLHRNFQGYTDDRSRYLVGLGASAISCLPQGYAQNASGTQAYLERVQGGKLATSRGYSLTAVDRLHGQIIDQLLCQFE
ncbi:MAG: radical SAM protein, partial [Candidatus Puniceispirillum sp.]